MLVWRHNWNLRISEFSWKKILHLKQNVIRKYQPEKIWNLSDVLFNLFPFSFLSGYNGNMTSQRDCSSLHIAMNSSLSSILFDFADTFILRNIKSQFFYYFSVQLHLLYVWKKVKFPLLHFYSSVFWVNRASFSSKSL